MFDGQASGRLAIPAPRRDNRPMDDDDWPRNLAYRMAFGLARRRIEEDGMRLARPDPNRLLKRLLEQVEREMRGDHRAREAIADGVADAVAGRQPRW